MDSIFFFTSFIDLFCSIQIQETTRSCEDFNNHCEGSHMRCVKKELWIVLLQPWKVNWVDNHWERMQLAFLYIDHPFFNKDVVVNGLWGMLILQLYDIQFCNILLRLPFFPMINSSVAKNILVKLTLTLTLTHTHSFNVWIIKVFSSFYRSGLWIGNEWATNKANKIKEISKYCQTKHFWIGKYKVRLCGSGCGSSSGGGGGRSGGGGL